MEQIISGLDNITLDPESGSTYEQVFDKVMVFAEKTQGYIISPNELAVNKSLAEPSSYR